MGYLKQSKNSKEMKEQPISVFWLLFRGSHFPIELPGEIPSQLSCLAVAWVWKWASSMKCVSNRKQLEDEKKRRETIEREKEQMLREKEELLVRLQEYEVKTQKAEKGKVFVLAEQTTYCAPQRGCMDCCPCLA